MRAGRSLHPNLTPPPCLWRWSDPGATAEGRPFGLPVDLSHLIQAYGIRGVDTSVPTDPSKLYGFIVTYLVRCEDTAKGYRAPMVDNKPWIAC